MWIVFFIPKTTINTVSVKKTTTKNWLIWTALSFVYLLPYSVTCLPWVSPFKFRISFTLNLQISFAAYLKLGLLVIMMSWFRRWHTEEKYIVILGVWNAIHALKSAYVHANKWFVNSVAGFHHWAHLSHAWLVSKTQRISSRKSLFSSCTDGSVWHGHH